LLIRQHLYSGPTDQCIIVTSSGYQSSNAIPMEEKCTLLLDTEKFFFWVTYKGKKSISSEKSWKGHLQLKIKIIKEGMFIEAYESNNEEWKSCQTMWGIERDRCVHPPIYTPIYTMHLPAWPLWEYWCIIESTNWIKFPI